MVNDSWQGKIDAYVDAELPAAEMRAMDAHLRECQSCAADALRRSGLKRSIRMAARQRYVPSPEFRAHIQQQIAPKKRGSWRWLLAPTLATASAAIIIGVVTLTLWNQQLERKHTLVQLADLHVATLASANPVDVASSDRHTVKPWFQGKLPFTFNLPEFQGTQFALLGGRMAYLAHEPGAQLVVNLRKHYISVFIFQDGPGFDHAFGNADSWAQPASFTSASWREGSLRYFVVTDASADDVRNLQTLFRTAARSPDGVAHAPAHRRARRSTGAAGWRTTIPYSCGPQTD